MSNNGLFPVDGLGEYEIWCGAEGRAYVKLEDFYKMNCSKDKRARTVDQFLTKRRIEIPEHKVGLCVSVCVSLETDIEGVRLGLRIHSHY